MKFICDTCGKHFKLKGSLNRHLRLVHKETKLDCKNLYLCWEKGCEQRFRRSNDLVDHLQTLHAINIEQEKKEFTSLRDFVCWKQGIEINEKCNYSSACGTKTLASGDKVSYYKCNRSGFFKSKAQTQSRMIKSQGSCKINGTCISQITLNEHLDGTLTLVRIKTHNGHLNDLQHLRLPKSDREATAAKLISGVSQTHILDTYRKNIGCELKRADLITNRDLLNIKRDFNINIQDGVKHTEDALSIEMWVDECRGGDNNPVLFYKRQGEKFQSFSDKDFCLIFMNEYQKDMLRNFGKNIIAIDGTHGLNNYDFELTTVMVVDEYGEGFPVACMFSNRKDTYVYSVFFEKIKESVGIIEAKIFMSDITEVFFNAWLSVMGIVKQKLYCSWHIDRAWQKNLSKISNIEKRNSVYKTLKTLQQTIYSEEIIFLENLNNFITSLKEDPDTENFENYFTSTYAKNFQQWAYCFRKGCGINTNMLLESMHKTVKYFYLNGKTVKRLDKGLHAVLNYIRDKMVDRIIKATKGKQTSTIKGIIQRHRQSITCNFSVKSIQHDKQWEIFSENNVYVIIKQNSVKCCQLICQYCNICIHCYICSCPDFNIKNTICKHIHFVVNICEKNTNLSNITNNVESLNTSQSIDISRCLETLNKSVCKDQLADTIRNKLSLVSGTVCDVNLRGVDQNMLSQILSQIQNLESLLHLAVSTSNLQNPNFKEVLSVSSNKKIDKQLTFHSTKKKRSKITHSVTKPSKDERQNINKFLSGDSLFISCSSTNDHNYL